MDRKNLMVILRRALALLLAIAIFLTSVLVSAANVTLNAAVQKTNAAVVAAMELLKSDEYANASVFNRVTTLMRTYLTVADSYEDYELGAAIAIARSKYADAMACTEQSIASYTGEAYGLGELYLRQGYLCTLMEDYEGALSWLDKGVKLCPTAEAYLTRAQICMQMGNVMEAARSAEASLAIKLPTGELAEDLTTIFERAGDYKGLLTMYDAQIAASDDLEAYFGRTYALVQLGRLDEAATSCRIYAGRKGVSAADALVMIGIGYLREGKYGEAKEFFMDAVDAGYAASRNLYYYIVLCAYMAEDYESACVYGDKAVALFTEGETVEAGAASTRGALNINLGATDVENLCFMTGAAHLIRGDYENAAQSLSACLKAGGSGASVYYLRGSCLLAIRRYEEALADFEAALAEGSDIEKNTYGRGICRMQLGDEAGALEDFDWVLLNGEDPEIFENATALTMEILARQAEAEAAKTAEATAGEATPDEAAAQEAAAAEAAASEATAAEAAEAVTVEATAAEAMAVAEEATASEAVTVEATAGEATSAEAGEM